MNYLLDTCVLSELHKPQPDPNVSRWILTQPADALWVSVITLAELERGICKLESGSARRRGLARWLEGLHNDYAARILPITPMVAIEWGQLTAASEKRGVTLPIMDAWIAAIARVHACHIATRNVEDMERCGAALLNPWEH